MSILKWLGFCLTIFCIDISESCKWTTFKLSYLNKKCMAHLWDISDFHGACVEEVVDGIFLKGFYNNTKSEDVAVVALKTFGYVEQLFDSKLTPSTWNNGTFHLFKNCIFRQIQGLQECVGGAESSGDGRSDTGVNVSLTKAYFEKLNTVLKEKGHSTCAWEVVRMALHDNLKQFRSFLELILKRK
ncbi:interferon alpha-1-like [Esox lucius]|uniref:Uncharacterized protein n=1 Tax=Esox lucius TaxID=8010 RepID=A0A6Q2YZH1_ESOLU|nr:interferon alpha-1-like [Esox lucius]